MKRLLQSQTRVEIFVFNVAEQAMQITRTEDQYRQRQHQPVREYYSPKAKSFPVGNSHSDSSKDWKETKMPDRWRKQKFLYILETELLQYSEIMVVKDLSSMETSIPFHFCKSFCMKCTVFSPAFIHHLFTVQILLFYHSNIFRITCPLETPLNFIHFLGPALSIYQ